MTTDTVEERPLEFEDDVAPATDTVTETEPEPEPADAVPDATEGGVPSWMSMPPNMRVPKGRKILFIRFPSKWTDSPGVGVRLPHEDASAIQLAGAGGRWRLAVCWPVDVGDQKHALGRAQGDMNRLADELTKQMIRSVDGVRVDWSGAPGEGSMDIWWNQIGQRNRNLMNRIWSQLHVHTREAQSAFFESCITVRSPAG